MPDPASALYEAQVADLKGQVADWKARHAEAVAQVRDATARLETLLGLKAKLEGCAPRQYRKKARGARNESTAFVQVSDWHCAERIDAATVNGVNEFNLQIAARRVEKLWQNILSLVEIERHGAAIDTLVLAVLGDLMTGMLHDDQREANYLSPVEEMLWVFRALEGGIDFLLEHGGFKTIFVPCVVGNHGRDTPKMRVATSTKRSYEWAVYQFLARRYREEGRVKFAVADGYFVFFEVYGKLVRAHHGDNVRYEGGVGGVTIPLNKAIAQWNKTKRADLDLLSHWHQRIMERHFALNSSLMGYGPYSIRVKASFEPPSQNFFLLNSKHADYGPVMATPIFLA